MLDDLSAFYLFHVGKFCEWQLVLEVVTEEIIIPIDIKFQELSLRNSFLDAFASSHFQLHLFFRLRCWRVDFDWLRLLNHGDWLLLLLLVILVLRLLDWLLLLGNGLLVVLLLGISLRIIWLRSGLLINLPLRVLVVSWLRLYLLWFCVLILVLVLV